MGLSVARDAVSTRWDGQSVGRHGETVASLALPLACHGDSVACSAVWRCREGVDVASQARSVPAPEVTVVEREMTPELLVRCMAAGHLLQMELARVLGVSERTVGRWMKGNIGPLAPGQLHALARAVYAEDKALAAELAEMAGTTVRALGLGGPPPGAIVLPAPAAVAAAAFLDSIVCAAADLHDIPTRELRPLLAAAFARAAALGLSAETVARGLAAPPKG